MERMIALEWSQYVENSEKARYGQAFFITLTYGEFSWDTEVIKRHLQAWQKRMYREFGVFGAFWKLELQQRGVPHYHLVVFFPERMSWNRVRKAARKAWVELTGAKVVDVQTVYAVNGDYGRLMRYMSKYMGKPWESDQKWGRVWGVWMPALIENGQEFIAELTWESWVEFLRRVRRWGKGSPYLESMTSRRLGLLVYGARGRLVQLLRGLEFYEFKEEES